MASKSQVDQIVAACDAIRATPIEELISNRERWGPLNFEASRPDLELVLGLTGHLRDLPLEILPPNVADGIISTLVRCQHAVNAIRTFSLDSSSQNPREMLANIGSELHAAAEGLLITAQSWIPFLAYQRGDVQRNMDALARSVTDSTKLLNDALAAAQRSKSDIDEIIRTAREASAGAGVGVFTHDFLEEASTQESVALSWLKITAAMGVATLIAAIGSAFIPLPADATQAQAIQLLSSKIVVLLVLIAATVWCGRIYKASKHQASMNRHRGNSLRTFQAFVKAASNDTTRDAVLLESTRSIFTIAPTGYLEGGEPAIDTGTKVLEIFKGGRAPSP